MELRAEDHGSAILAMILPNKGNDSSTEVTYELAVQGIIEAVRPAVCHDDLNSKTILQLEYVRIRSWGQVAVSYIPLWLGEDSVEFQP